VTRWRVGFGKSDPPMGQFWKYRPAGGSSG